MRLNPYVVALGSRPIQSSVDQNGCVDERAAVLGLAQGLTIPLTLLMIIASGFGLFAESLYLDNRWSTSGFRGNDLITLVIAVPLMSVSLVASRRGSLRGHLIWLGTIAYALYNYLFYLFGAAFNDLFLIYVAVVALALWTLILGLVQTDPGAAQRALSPNAPLRWVAANMILIGSFLGIAWIAQSLDFVVTGTVPQSVEDSGIQTAIVFALDLTLIVPSMFIAAWLTWTKRLWGVVMSAVLMVKAAAYTLALISMSFFAAAADVEGAWDFLPVWIALSLTSIAACWLLFSNMRETSRC